MRKILIIVMICAVLLASLGVALLWQSNYGYVLITDGAWKFENSLTRALVVSIPVLVAAYIVVSFLLKIWRFPSLYRGFRRKRSSERSRRHIIQGLIELAEGHWHKAEQMLLKDIQSSDTPLLNYLLAARAAQQQDADDRRDQYLKRAHEITPKADIAIGLTQAELQMAHGQTEQSLATLTRLREFAPKHPYVLKLLSRLYAQLNEWEKLAALLPEIRKRRILPDDKLLELERTTYTQFIRFIAKANAVFSLEEQWKILPKRYREDPEIFKVYIDCLLETQNPAAADKHLRAFLAKNWDEQLIQLYGRVELPQTSKQLDHAETWLKEHGRSPMLLLSLARLSNRLRLWGKARVYYESSLGIHPTVEAYAELAELLESLGERDSAYECFRKGLSLATSRSHSRRSTDGPQNGAVQTTTKTPAAQKQNNTDKNSGNTKNNLVAIK